MSCRASYVKPLCLESISFTSERAVFCILEDKQSSYKVNAIVALVVSSPAIKNIHACATTLSPAKIINKH